MLFVSLQPMNTLHENHMSLVPSDMCFKGFQVHFVSNTSGTDYHGLGLPERMGPE